MFTQKIKPRGRPRGETAQGDATRRRLYQTALKLIAERGYEAATLREIAATAGVSASLLYRYFPGKSAVVRALYDELSIEFEEAAGAMPAGRWRDRFLFTLRTSLAVLAPERETLASLTSVLVGDAEEGIFAPATAFSRLRVQSRFIAAVVGSSDAPVRADAEALGRALYLVHLAVLLFWLLDRTVEQRGTEQLVVLIARLLPAISLALKVGSSRRAIRALDELVRTALYGEPA